MSRRIPLLPVLAVPAVAFAVAGCGGTSHASSKSSTTSKTTAASKSSGSTARGATLKLAANPGGELRFSVSKLTAPKPGKITLVMTNPSSAGIVHAIAIDANGGDHKGAVVGPGHTSTVTVDLKKGTYTYYCPVPGHRQGGMVGTLTVK